VEGIDKPFAGLVFSKNCSMQRAALKNITSGPYSHSSENIRGRMRVAKKQGRCLKQRPLFSSKVTVTA
jgi:hypothetical protein